MKTEYNALTPFHLNDELPSLTRIQPMLLMLAIPSSQVPKTGPNWAWKVRNSDVGDGDGGNVKLYFIYIHHVDE